MCSRYYKRMLSHSETCRRRASETYFAIAPSFTCKSFWTPNLFICCFLDTPVARLGIIRGGKNLKLVSGANSNDWERSQQVKEEVWQHRQSQQREGEASPTSCARNLTNIKHTVLPLDEVRRVYRLSALPQPSFLAFLFYHT